VELTLMKGARRREDLERTFEHPQTTHVLVNTMITITPSFF